MKIRFVARPPLYHGVEDGAKGSPELGERVDDAGRDFGKDLPLNEPVCFERA